jgi:hypothetical protein
MSRGHYDDEDDHIPNERELKPIKGYFTDLGEARIKKPKWGIKGVATTGVTIVIGPPKGAFKTTVEMAMALLISRHEHSVLPAEWEAGIHGPSLIFEAESDAGELREMTETGMGVKIRADESILVCDRPEEFMLDSEDGVEQIIHWREERDCAFVGLGPLANFHIQDEKDANAVTRLLTPLRRDAKKHDYMVAITHHTRKIEEGKTYSANDARGSSALFGMCDNILVITPGRAPYELLIKREGKKGKAWEKVFFLNVWDRVGMKEAPPPFTLPQKMILKLMRQVTGKISLTMAVTSTGLKPATVEKALKELIKMKYLVTDGTTEGNIGPTSACKNLKPERLK